MCALFYSPSKICFPFFTIFHMYDACVCVYTKSTDRPVCEKFLVYFLENEFMKKIGFGSPFSSFLLYVRIPPQIFHSHYTFLSFNSHTFSLHHSNPPHQPHPTNFLFILMKEKLFLKHTLRYRLDLISHSPKTLSTQRSYC